MLKLHCTVIQDIDTGHHKDNQIIATISADINANNNSTSKSVRVYTSDGLIHKLDSHSEFSGDETPLSLCLSQDVFSLAVG